MSADQLNIYESWLGQLECHLTGYGEPLLRFYVDLCVVTARPPNAQLCEAFRRGLACQPNGAPTLGFEHRRMLATSWLVLGMMLGHARIRSTGEPPATINTGGCDYRQVLAQPFTTQHVKVHLLELPPDMADHINCACGRQGLWWLPPGHRELLGKQLPWSFTPQGLPNLQPPECSYGLVFDTHPHNLPAYYRHHLIESPMRVLNIQDADIVFVDMVDDRCMEQMVWDKMKQAYLPALKFVEASIKTTGKPHVIVNILNELFYPPDSLPSLPNNVTFINLELSNGLNYLWLHGDNKLLTVDKEPLTNTFSHRTVPTPYPSTIHLDAHDPYFTLLGNTKQHTGGAEPEPPCYIERKKLLAIQSFNTRFPLRAEMRRQCEAAGNDTCLHLEWQSALSVVTRGEIHELYGHAWFCIMPPGDTHSRRAIYDCLLQDAIPVVFRKFTLNNMPYNDVVDPHEYMVALPELHASLTYLGTHESKRPKAFALVEDAKDVLGLLQRRYPLERRVQMVRTVFQLKHMFQTMIRPVHQVLRFDELNTVHCLDDAFTSTIKATLRNLCRRGLLPAERCKGA